MDCDDTLVFNVEEISEQLVYQTLKEVSKNLKERGYNPTNQIVGYILSGDLGYISSYKNSRKKIASLDRSTIIEILLRKFLKWDT